MTNSELPLLLALWLAIDDYDSHPEFDKLSATTLLRSPRYIIGQLRKLFPEKFPKELLVNDLMTTSNDDLEALIPSRIGTAVHNAVEQAWLQNKERGLARLGYSDSVIKDVVINPTTVETTHIPVYLEQRLEKEIDGYRITGKFDAVIDGQLNDIKKTSTFTWTSGCNDMKYMLQGSIYRWLNPTIITKSTVLINFIFSDWSKFRAAADTNYPQSKIIGKEYSLLSIKETEAYIRNKIRLVKKYLYVPLLQIPCCTKEDLFSSPPTYKYYKDGFTEGKRSTKNFDSLSEAELYMSKNFGRGEIITQYKDPFMCPFCNPEEVAQMQSTTPMAKPKIV